MSNFNFNQIPTNEILCMASSPNTPTDTLEKLAFNNLPSIVVRVAENPNTSSKVLTKLASHEIPEVRLAVAENSNTPVDTLQVLVKDESPDVRYMLAECMHIPTFLLELLSKDHNPYVSTRALKTLTSLGAEPNINSNLSNAIYIDEINDLISQFSQLDNNLQIEHDRALEEADLMSDYLRYLSYQLRVPLGVINGMSELLLSTELNQEQKELAGSINEAGQALLKIVQDLADIPELEDIDINLEAIPFNVIYILEDSARTLANLAKEEKAILSTHIDHRIPEFVLGDPQHMREILYSLIRHAILSAEGKTVDVEALVKTETSTDVTIQFTIGEIGYRQTESTSKVTGSSQSKYGNEKIKIAINKQLIEAMGGRLKVVETKVGTAICFEIQFRRISPIQIPSQTKNDQDNVKVKPGVFNDKLILVVEDDPTLSLLAVKQLANLGFNAQAVSTGHKAVNAVKNKQFDLILMDCYLPEMDGFKATKIIRQMEENTNRHTPIIAMTAAAMVGDDSKCKEAGMDDYLSKPVSLGQLQEKLNQWVKVSKQSSQYKSVT